MTNSFQSDIKNVLIDINNGDYSTLKDNYNKVFGKDEYDRLIYSINNIENNSMINGSYEKDDLEDITQTITKFYEYNLNSSISNQNLDLRNKESLLESFQKEMIDLVDKHVKGVDNNELQNQRRFK